MVGGASKFKNKDEASAALLNSMYRQTQDHLREQGIKTMTVYRGVITDDLNGISKGTTVKLNGNAMESWTVHPIVARDFAGGSRGNGRILAMEVPASRILSTPKTGFGCVSEFEVVVLGGKDMGEAVVVR